MVVDGLAQGRQGLGEREHVLELGALADLTKPGVITILLAALGVAAGGLDVAVGLGADPHIRVGRRDRQGTDAVERALILDLPAARPDIDEPFSDLPAADPRPFVRHVGEAGRLGGIPRIDDVVQGRVLFQQHGSPWDRKSGVNGRHRVRFRGAARSDSRRVTWREEAVSTSRRHALEGGHLFPSCPCPPHPLPPRPQDRLRRDRGLVLRLAFPAHGPRRRRTRPFGHGRHAGQRPSSDHRGDRREGHSAPGGAAQPQSDGRRLCGGPARLDPQGRAGRHRPLHRPAGDPHRRLRGGVSRASGAGSTP